MRAAVGSSRATRPARAAAWWLAVRPWSFTISLAPVLAGTTLAALDGFAPDLAIAALALLACVLIHAGTNLQNDVGDFRRGADLVGRIGPPRVTTQGWLPASQVQTAASLSFALAFVPGAYLVVRGGWPIVAIGLASIAAGAVYTAGPRPVAYSGWGEAFVIVFFGLVAVCGIYYLHAGTVGAAALLAGAALGLLAAAVLVVNNLRDIDSDRRIGKNTLAVRLGRERTRTLYAAMIGLSFALQPLVLLAGARWAPALVALLAAPLAIKPLQAVRTRTDGPALNAALAQTGALLAVFAILAAIALAI
jgi:1,4-dihydroxy-2-naphthoate octaprenyltransferase